jgi:hypothetical protein
MAAFWAEMGVTYLEINKLPFLLKKFGKSHWSESIFTGHGPPDHC